MERCMVILAGGSGKRLWPLSRTHLPKQLVPLPHGTTLLQQTLQRALNSVTAEHIFVATTPRYASLIRQQTDGYRDIFIEPASRNTAAALWWSCQQLERIYQDDVVVLFTPSDHVIENHTAFDQAAQAAYESALRHDTIILLGIEQHFISTQFGFIAPGAYIPNATLPTAYVHTFHEKPTPEKAHAYFENKTLLWNSGIVCARLSVLLMLFRAHCTHYWHTPYHELPVQSFDHAILEKHAGSIVIQSSFSWRDVGTLPSFIPAFYQQQKTYVEIGGAKHNTVITKKPIIVGGISDAYIIEMDDVIVVMSKSSASCEQLLDELIQKGWGTYV